MAYKGATQELANHQRRLPRAHSSATETSRRNLNLFIMLAVVAGVVTFALISFALAIVPLLPRMLLAPGPSGTSSQITLALNYSKGEKMTYDLAIGVNAMGQNYTQSTTINMEVLDFDGSAYTIRVSSQFAGLNMSYIANMDRTGRISNVTGLPSSFQQLQLTLINQPGMGTYFPKIQANVGDSWQIPLNMNFSGIGLTGTIDFRIAEITKSTVPAGTYNVFKIDFTGNIQGTVPYMNTTSSTSMNMSGYENLEMGTCLTIDSSVQTVETASIAGQTTSMYMTVQMRLMTLAR